MADLLPQITAEAFRYPLKPHQRRHGPRGYLDYTSYKPWLRDEFVFRCVYCLTRERWQSDGHESFGADHFNPQAVQPALRNDYNNLFYVCCSCNAARNWLLLPLNPTQDALGDHLQIALDGFGRCAHASGRGVHFRLPTQSPCVDRLSSSLVVFADGFG
jgi:hypothetical protein